MEISNLGPEASKAYAINREILEGQAKYIEGKTPPLSSKDIVETTPPQVDSLLGSLQNPPYAEFTPLPQPNTIISAFREGSLIPSIGSSETLEEKIAKAPEKNTKIGALRDLYKKLNADAAYIFNHQKEYSKG